MRNQSRNEIVDLRVSVAWPKRPEKDAMLHVLAHITQQEVPSFWLAAMVGFVAGVAVTFGIMVRKVK